MPDEAGEAAAREILVARLRAGRRRSPARPRLGRGLEPAVAAGRGHRDGRPQGRHARPARERRADPGHEHDSQAPLRHPGRAPRPRHARARAGARDLGRDRRRSHAHRLGAVLAGSDHLRRRDRHPLALRRGGSAVHRVAPRARRSRGRSPRRPSRATRGSRASRTASSPRRTRASWPRPLSCSSAASRRWSWATASRASRGRSPRFTRRIARQMRAHSHPFKPPVAIISGGETTVTAARRTARAGAAASSCCRSPSNWQASTTPGRSRPTRTASTASEANAGAIVAPDTLARSTALGLDAKRMLADNDGFGFFAALGDLVVTGPTRTNVNDYRIVLRPVSPPIAMKKPTRGSAFSLPCAAARMCVQAAFSSLAVPSFGSGRSISSTSAIGALSPCLKPHLRMRR